jgi:putative flippase GtrA
MRRFSLELLGYGLASAVALTADLAVLTSLVNWAGWHYLPASVLAFIAGAVVTYALCAAFVFRFRQIGNRALELGYFVGLGVAGLFVNSAALFIAVGAVGIGLVPAKLLAAACTFATNFTLRRHVLFSPARYS